MPTLCLAEPVPQRFPRLEAQVQTRWFAVLFSLSIWPRLPVVSICFGRCGATARTAPRSRLEPMKYYLKLKSAVRDVPLSRRNTKRRRVFVHALFVCHVNIYWFASGSWRNPEELPVATASTVCSERPVLHERPSAVVDDRALSTFSTFGTAATSYWWFLQAGTEALCDQGVGSQRSPRRSQ